MRSFYPDDVVAVSGLSLLQVEELVATSGFPLYGPGLSDPGHAFLAPDLFNFGLAASLLEIGLGLLSVCDLIAGLGECERHGETGQPVEMFPGQRREVFGPSLFVVRMTEDGPRATLVTPSELWAGVTAYGASTTIVINATNLAEHIATIVPGRELSRAADATSLDIEP